MRRSDREITDRNKMMEILSACDCCRLGLIDENGAYIVPLNFGYEEIDGKILLYFHGAAAGKKFDLISAQKTAAFEMDRKHQLIKGTAACAYSYLYQSIMGNGTIQILNHHEEKIHALNVLMSHYSDKSNWDFKREQADMIAIIKMEVTNWSCKEHQTS